jgi:inner membrane protein
VYGSKLRFSGSFSALAQGDPSVQKQNMLFDEAFVSVGISDLRGLEDQIAIKWNNDESSFNPGVESFDIIKSGINAPIRINPSDTGDVKYNFSFNLSLKGSQYIYFTPVGKETKVNLASEWTTPSFDGAFLPDTRNIDAKGFSAFWKVLHLNRNYPQRWISDKYTVESSSFGINLIVPIDHYTKTDRSIKYAILFIALTFLIFFFLELINNKAVHFIQYTLIGFALCIFYVLLLSISEHLPYNLAYWIASFMTIGLIAWYTRSILKDKKLSALVAGNLLLLYGFIFTIIQLEDYALLIGSLGLFLILAVVMYFSKKIDWAGLSGK